MAEWLFKTNTVEEGPASWNDFLFIRLTMARGVSIQELPQGTFRALRWPTQDEIKDAYRFFMGGHEYVVDDATRTALIAGGVDVTAANFTPI